jgi:hypothetical protein
MRISEWKLGSPVRAKGIPDMDLTGIITSKVIRQEHEYRVNIIFCDGLRTIRGIPIRLLTKYKVGECHVNNL